jgi:hypothetical protein
MTILTKKTMLIATLILVVALAFAAGLAVGVFYRTYPGADNWNDSSLTATARSVYLEGERGKEGPVFFYILENHTDRDYSADSPSDTQMLVRDEGALDNSWLQGLSVDLPIFIPSGEKISATVHFRMIESEQPNSQDPNEIQAFISDSKRTWHTFDGFVLLDKRNRYRVNFPLPWR